MVPLTHKQRLRVFLCLLPVPLLVQELKGEKILPVFTRIDPVTRSDIRGVFAPDTSCTFILTDKIFIREGETWKRIHLQDAKTIDRFFPISGDDFWYTVNTALNTTELYHYLRGRTEKVASPFANEIISLNFPEKNLGFFGGWGEISVYENGNFRKLPPPPSIKEVIKIFGTSAGRIWMMSANGELFFFSDQKYTRILPGEKNRDFFVEPDGEGFVLTAGGLYTLSQSRCTPLFISSGLSEARTILKTGGNSLIITGEKGFIKIFRDGVLRDAGPVTGEDLTATAVSGNEIWITGKNGVILYSGWRRFTAVADRQTGFSRYKIYNFGGDADDEYGVAVADFNGDGWNDIYSVCIYNPNRLYINKKEELEPSGPGVQESAGLHFHEEALKRGASGIPEDIDPGSSVDLQLGVTSADEDNDGDQDLYLCSLNNRNRLLLNDGSGYFRDVSDQENRACADMNRSNAAAFADVDNDGDLDLFVTSEKATNRLFLNDGAGQFTDVTSSSGLASVRGGMCASFADINLDGLPDLCVTSWFGPDKIYLNITRGKQVRFRDITPLTDLAHQEPGRSNAVVFADVNNDGLPDLFIARRNAPNRLYLNSGNGIFRNAGDEFFTAKSYLSNGAVFADFDLDGYTDLYITNVGENIYYRNPGGKGFMESTDEAGADLRGYCTGCAAGDFNNDGVLDLYVANYINGNSTLFINSSDPARSLRFILTGTRSNRDAVGAKIILYKPGSNGKMQMAGMREISGGGGYGSISAKEAVFGVEPGVMYRAVILFPASGKRIELENLMTGKTYRVSEETGIAAFRSRTEKAIARFFLDRENQFEILKYILVSGLLLFSLFIHLKKKTIKQNILFLLYTSLFALFITFDRLLRFDSLGVSFFVPSGIVVVALVLIHLLTERIHVRKMAERDKLAVRESISRDLHDDLASTLGSISIYSNTLKSFGKTRDANFPYLAEKIAELAGSAIQSISDIIWMTSPKHDSLNSLLSKTRNYYYDLFNDNLIRFNSDVEMPGKDTLLTDRLRHNIFLILKEVANNILRHSEATDVSLVSAITRGECMIEVNDNGKGFTEISTEKGASHGHGLLNMHRRATESGIDLVISSQPGSGTMIRLTFKITQMDY